MLDIISMIILIIFMILFGIITILIIIGGNMNKSEEERKREDEEQIQYINKYTERKQLKKRSKWNFYQGCKFFNFKNLHLCFYKRGCARLMTSKEFTRREKKYVFFEISKTESWIP